MNSMKANAALNAHCGEFTGPMQLIEYASTERSLEWNNSSFTGLRLNDPNDWETVRKAMLGLPANNGLGNSRAIADKPRDAIHAPRSVKRTFRYNDYDGEPCADRYLAGESKFMGEMRKRNRDSAREVVLCMNGAEHCGITPTQLNWKSVAFATAIDLLESAGYTVSAYYFFQIRRTYREGPRDAFVSVKVKEAGDPLDLADILNSTSSWYFRNPVFSTLVKASPATVSSHLGYPDHKKLRPEFQEYMGGISANVQMVEMNKHAYNQEYAEASIHLALKAVEEFLR